MKYLVLGAGSFAGQAIFSHLLREGKDVIGVNRSPLPQKNMWPWLNSLSMEGRWKIFNIYSDLEDLCKFIYEASPNIVIDLMGQGMVAPSWDDPRLWYCVNLANKAKVLQQLERLDSLELYIRASTPEVFGSSTNYLSENDSFNPSTPYAISHAGIDHHIRCIGRENGFPYLIARFANFYGVGQQFYRVIPRIFLAGYSNDRFILDGGGESVRSFINSDDVVSAYSNMLKKGKPMNEYHFGGTEEVSISDLVDIICEVAGFSRGELVKDGPERRGKDQCYRLNCYRSFVELGWQPKIELRNGLYKVGKWISDNIDEFSKYSWSYEHKV